MLVWFLSCLYRAVSLTLVREQRFIRIIIIIRYERSESTREQTISTIDHKND